MKPNLQTTLILGLFGVVAWQSWSLVQLQDRLTVIEQTASNGNGASATQVVSARFDARGDRARHPNQQRGIEAQTRNPALRAETRTKDAVDIASPENQEVIQGVVSQAIEKRDAERRQERIDNWTSMATQRYQDQVATISDEYNVNSSTQEQVVDLLVESMQQRMSLRHEVSAGDISYQDAKIERTALKDDTAASVADLIGDDAAEALWADIESERGHH